MQGIPWHSSGWDSTPSLRGPRFDPWLGWGRLCRAENENSEEEEGIGYKKNFLSFELVEFDGLFCFIFCHSFDLSMV